MEDAVQYLVVEPPLLVSQLGTPGGPALLTSAGVIETTQLVGAVTTAVLPVRDTSLVLHPAYPNAVTSAGAGVTLASYVPAAGGAHYYSFRKTTSTVVNSTVSVKVTLPDGFVDWASGASDLALVIRTETSSNNKGTVAVAVWDTAGAAVALSGDTGAQNSASANTDRTIALTFRDGTWAAGGTMTVQVTAGVASSGAAPLATLVGALRLSYRTQ